MSDDLRGWCHKQFGGIGIYCELTPGHVGQHLADPGINQIAWGDHEVGKDTFVFGDWDSEDNADDDLRREFAAFLADIVASLEQISQDPDVTRGVLLALEGLALTIDTKRVELQDPS